MSFILDALRKSEHERQRQTGPGVSDWRAATVSRPTFPVWAIGIAALLAVNLVVVLIFALRGSFSEPASVTAEAANVVAPPTPTVQPSSSPIAPPTPSSASIPPPAPAPAPSPIPEQTTMSRTEQPLPEPELHNTSASATGDEMLPTLNDLTLSGAKAPKDLHLDVHVYAPRRNERFVFIDNRKYTEGDRMPDGTSVERITTDGVVLNHHGTRFLLPRQ